MYDCIPSRMEIRRLLISGILRRRKVEASADFTFFEIYLLY